MRIFIVVLILIFSFGSWTKADDIKDFEIEGMSIGDSALIYFNKAELIKRKKYYRNTDSKIFYRTSISSPKFKNYDNIMFHFKDNDSSFKIYGISAAIWFSENGIRNADDCLVERNKIDKELIQLFKNLKREVVDNNIHAADVTGKSITHNIRYWFKENDNAGISCYVYSKEFGGTSHLKVMVNSSDLIDWINNVVYK
tara:strand:- start:123 stop:716 length:594 start_codon:yes stop_codon:yes gene_type:complete